MTEQQARGRPDGDTNGHRRGARPRMGARDAMRSAHAHLRELTGKNPEAVVSIEADGQGWRVALEVIELERIPNTTDLLACYELQLDEHGELVGYRRLRRYARSEQSDGVGA
jgi:Gas vesicle synthesis protein GvpO